ncbi:hypothetical protein V2P20_09250 [Methylobacter sp. Wu1]|uniref:hypothetical protein n=1 Tax=Methylobacter sp. Wu1 TaxID=3119359 RepID=UPI002F956A32
MKTQPGTHQILFYAKDGEIMHTIECRQLTETGNAISAYLREAKVKPSRYKIVDTIMNTWGEP